jgi:hypothetical protein
MQPTPNLIAKAAVVADQGAATTGFGDQVALRHDLTEPTTI